jgi:hypothetical protein
LPRSKMIPMPVSRLQLNNNTSPAAALRENGVKL